MSIGTLHADVPVNVEYAIKIYNLPDHTLLYNSDQQRNFTLFPGTYDIEISGMAVKNIPVDKGRDTRIKAGVLNMSYNLPWTLYDENKLKILYKSSLPKKVEFPKGIYQVKISGTSYLIEIKDGETLDYDSTKPFVLPQKIDSIDSNAISKIQQPNISDSNKISQPKKLNITDSANNKLINQEVINDLFDDKNWEIKPGISKTAQGKIFIKIARACFTSVFVERYYSIGWRRILTLQSR